METIFEKIIGREVAADIIYEDDSVISFLDIRPIVKEHALVVPKQKFINIFDGDPEILGKMMITAQKVACALLKVTGATGINIKMNNGESAGQDVFHAHIHVVPRFRKNETFLVPNHESYEVGESEALALQIKTLLS